MDANKRTQIRRTLRSLAEAHAATIDLMEQTLTLLSDELAMDAIVFWKSRGSAVHVSSAQRLPNVDYDHLQVMYQGKTCFLGNTLPFRFLARLVRRPNRFFTYEELQQDVWEGPRSDAAIRSVVKRLRQSLRRQGMPELAEAIDGSMAGRYRLRIDG